MEKQLPGRLFVCRTNLRGCDGRQSQTLIVHKQAKGAEYQLAKEKYMDDVARMESKVEPFRSQTLRNMFGDYLYGELVLLNRLPGSQAAQAANSDPPSVAGVKREAQDDSVFPPASRSLPGYNLLCRYEERHDARDVLYLLSMVPSPRTTWGSIRANVRIVAVISS